MPVSGNDYFGTLGADLTGLEYILDQVANRLQTGVAANEATGAGTPTLGTNCPAVTPAGINRWMKITLSDGSTGFIPVWK